MWYDGDLMVLDQTANGGDGGVDYEQVLSEALVNEGAHTKVLALKRTQFVFNEKQIRDEAAAEVAHHQLQEAQNETRPSTSGKRKSMHPDEKVQINRDRNREHAKNTRLRKKMYVTKLKELFDKMTAQRTADEAERRALGLRIHEMQTIRKNVVRLLLSYRSTNMRDREKWAVILDESFEFTLPITPYRSFPKHNIVNSSHVVTGIDAVIADTASLALMAQSICYGTPQWQAAIKCGQACRLAYTVSRDDMVVAGEWVMCRFSLRTEGSEQVGALYGCVQHGMLQAHFNSENKLVAAEMMFDVMGFMQQLQRASSISPESSIVPNTIDMALLPSKEIRAILYAKYPFPIVHVNDSWVKLYNRPQSAVEGVPFCEVIQAPKPQEEQILILAAECASGKPVGALALVHSRHDKAEPALIYVKLYPLTRNDKSVSHLLVVQTDLPLSQAEMHAVRQHLSAQSAQPLSSSTAPRVKEAEPLRVSHQGLRAAAAAATADNAAAVAAAAKHHNPVLTSSASSSSSSSSSSSAVAAPTTTSSSVLDGEQRQWQHGSIRLPVGSALSERLKRKAPAAPAGEDNEKG